MQVQGEARSIAGNSIQVGALRATQGGIGDVQTGRHEGLCSCREE